MGYLIQKKSAVINIIDTARAVGQQIVNVLTCDCLAKPIHKSPSNDVIQIYDIAGLPTQSFTLDGTLQYQDEGGSPATWSGTSDALADKLNTVYFNNFRTDGAANNPSQQKLTDPSSVAITGWNTIAFACSGTITATIDSNAIIYPYTLGSSVVLGAELSASSVSLNDITFDGTGTVLITIKQ